jgi:hypothetical protein
MSPFMPKNYLQAQRHYYWKKKRGKYAEGN